MDWMLTISELIDEAIEEKAWLLGQLIYYSAGIEVTFEGSKYKKVAQLELQKYIISVMGSVNWEHRIYDKIMNYLNTSDEIDEWEFREYIETFNQAFSDRFSEYTHYLNNYNLMIMTRNLTEKNYRIYSKGGFISSEEYSRIYEKIPQK